MFQELCEPTLCEHAPISFGPDDKFNSVRFRCCRCNARWALMDVWVRAARASDLDEALHALMNGPEWEPNGWRDQMLGNTGPQPRNEWQ